MKRACATRPYLKQRKISDRRSHNRHDHGHDRGDGGDGHRHSSYDLLLHRGHDHHSRSHARDQSEYDHVQFLRLLLYGYQPLPQRIIMIDLLTCGCHQQQLHRLLLQ